MGIGGVYVYMVQEDYGGVWGVYEHHIYDVCDSSA